MQVVPYAADRRAQRAEMAAHACVHDHYGAVTEGPRRPVTSAPHVARSICVAPPEKARPLRTTATTTAII
jgi:hypothetical protein